MEIRKEYNVEELSEKLKEEIDNSKKYNGVVKLDVITTLEILDVLLETHRREQKHQTIESALVFESEIPCCFGKYDTDDKEVCTCVFCEYELDCRRETELKQKKRRPDCFNVMCGDFEACKRCEYRSDCVHEVKEQKQREGITINE